MHDQATNLRIQRLEAQVAKLQATLQEFPARTAEIAPRRGPRIAVTAILDGESSYPSDPSANTFGVIFADLTYTPSKSGQIAPDLTLRQSKALTTAQTIDGSYVAQGTTVIVAIDNGRWWIIRGGGVASASSACSILGGFDISSLDTNPAEQGDRLFGLLGNSNCMSLFYTTNKCPQCGSTTSGSSGS